MSEKRFTIDNTNRIFDNKDIMSKTEVVAMLNNLYDENEQLRILLKERQYEKDISKCREENIKLQQVLSENEKMLQKDLDMLTELRRENEQLRKVLRERQYKKDIALCDLVNSLTVENRELRQQVQNAKELAVQNDVQYQICCKEKEDFQNMCEQLRHDLDNLQKSINYWQNQYKEILDKIPPKIKEVWIE